jgi:penicillin-binding protein 1A
MELTQAYAAFAAGQYPVRARGLPEAEESWYDRMMSRQNSMNRRERQMMLELMWASVNQGTGRAAALPVQAFGKTGTTQDSRDALFIGFAGDLVTGVWIGNDDNSPLGKSVTGGTLPAQIWRNFMSKAVDTRTGRVAPPPPTPSEVDLTPVYDGLPSNVSVPIGDSGYDVGIAVGPDEVTISAGPSGAETRTRVDPIAPEEEPLPEPGPGEPVVIAPPPTPPTIEEEPEGLEIA